MYHLAAYYQSVDPAASLKQINAVPDQAIFTSGADVRVPTGLANLIGEAALSAATTPLYGQVQSPTLRDLANQDIEPISTSAKFTSYDQMQWHGDSPRDLTEAESVNFAIYATGGAAAVNYGLIFLGDGAVKPTTGKIFSVRATGSASLSAGAWINTALDFNSTLPSGTYQVVGMRAEGTNLVAARIVFIGGQFRPGVPATSATNLALFPWFRVGRAGVFGSFDVNQPPTIDCLGVTDTSQEFVFDLIKTK